MRALQGAYQINHATNFEQARAGVMKFTCPVLNVMYGDVAGNIGCGLPPNFPFVRHILTKFFLDGSSGKDEYLGFMISRRIHRASIRHPASCIQPTTNQIQ